MPALVAAGGLVVLLVSLSSIAAAPVVTPAARLSAAARVLGMLAAYASLVVVLLVARLPAVERAVPAHLIRRWHGVGGAAVLLLSSAHAVFAVAGQAALTRSGVLAEVPTVALRFRLVLPATVGLGLLIIASALSARPLRYRIGYLRWRVLHLTTYLAVALAFGHELLGVELRSAVARAVWSALFVLTALAVAWYRVAGPLVVSRRHQLRVASVLAEAPDTWSVRVTGHDLDRLGARPGQYLRWRILASGAWARSRPYSLSAVPTADGLRFTVKARGDAARAVRDLRPGTRIAVEGPYGALTERWRTRRRVLLIAGGMGVAPLRALFEGMWAEPGHLTLLYRAARAEDLIFVDELDGIASERGAHVHYLVGPPGGAGRPEPLAPVALAATVDDVTACDAYVCGPPGMVETAVASLLAAGVPAHQIHAETYIA